MSQGATSVLSVRMTPAERELLEAAAEQSRSSLSDFVRRRAIEAAELEIMERRAFVIPAEKWEEVESMMREPAKNIPGLQRLKEFKPVWEK